MSETEHGATDLISETPDFEVDQILAAAVDLARAAAVETGADTVGEYLGAQREGELLVTHAFASTLLGYVGWYWAVSLIRAPQTNYASVADVVLLPGAQALLAPAWVPWSERVRAGDLGPGDLLPSDPADPRLVPAYMLSDDPAVEATAGELGLGRERVMSRDGRLEAAERWYAGEVGPDSPMARQAPARCGTCGFLLPLAGSLQAGFGVCGNEISSTDGHVVSVEYGCGAHSQAKVVIPSLSEPVGELYDDGDEITVKAPRQRSRKSGRAAKHAEAEAAVEPAAVVEVSATELEGATFAAVLGEQDPASDAEERAAEAGPEPEPMIVSTEPAPERD